MTVNPAWREDAAPVGVGSNAGAATAVAIGATPDCQVDRTAPNKITCNLIRGETRVSVPHQKYARLTNLTGAPLQINQITANTGEQLYWSEFCVYLDEFWNIPNAQSAARFSPGQLRPGKGEVGCGHKVPGENYPALQWDGYRSALLVPAGSSIYLSAHTARPANETQAEDHLFTLSVYPATTGVSAYRAPALDTVIACDGKVQSTPWNAWKNDSRSDLFLGGATVYAVGGDKPSAVDHACLYIIGTNGKVRWNYCGKGVNARGRVAFTAQAVHPGESIAGQATNQCAPGGLWDYAVYLYVGKKESFPAPTSNLAAVPLGGVDIGTCFPGNGGSVTRQVFTYKQIYNAPTADMASLRAYMYYPPNFNPALTYPTIAIFHGGGWATRSPLMWDSEARYFASRGAIVAAVQYRLSSVYETPLADLMVAPAADARSAIRWLRKNAAALRVNANRIVAVGDSAGGTLALAVALESSPSEESAADAAYSSVPNAIIVAYPVVDFGGTLDTLAPQNTLWKLNYADKISPMKGLVSASLPPTLYMQGDADEHPWTPPAAARRFCSAAGTCTYDAFPGQGHAFIDVIGVNDTVLTHMDTFLIDKGMLPGSRDLVAGWVSMAAPQCHFDYGRVTELEAAYGLTAGRGRW